MISLSEIDTTAKRASRAIGFSWGIAEEIGKNTKLLELFGLPGVKNLISYYKVYNKKKFQKISLISQTNKTKIPYCPINLGVNFLDQAYILNDLKKINLENVSFPLLFLPFVSRSSEIIGKKINIEFDNFEFLLNYNQSIFCNHQILNIIENAQNVSIKFLENVNTFKENEWQELYRLSEDTFVEETESLRETAAGAGLTDND